MARKWPSSAAATRPAMVTTSAMPSRRCTTHSRMPVRRSLATGRRMEAPRTTPTTLRTPSRASMASSWVSRSTLTTNRTSANRASRSGSARSQARCKAVRLRARTSLSLSLCVCVCGYVCVYVCMCVCGNREKHERGQDTHHRRAAGAAVIRRPTRWRRSDTD